MSFSPPTHCEVFGSSPRTLIQGDAIRCQCSFGVKMQAGHDGTLAHGWRAPVTLDHGVGRARLSNLEVWFRAGQLKECVAASGHVWLCRSETRVPKPPSTGLALYLNQQVYWFSLCQHKLTCVPEKEKRAQKVCSWLLKSWAFEWSFPSCHGRQVTFPLEMIIFTLFSSVVWDENITFSQGSG